MYWYFQIAFLFILEGAQIIKRSFLVKIIKQAYWFLAAAVFGYSAYLTWAQYKLWSHQSLSKYLLPPETSIFYFIGYSLWRFWAANFVALIFSALFFIIAKKLNKKFGERFFENEEILLGSLIILACGYPIFIIYFILLLASFLFANTLITSIKKETYRVSLYYFWIPAALIAIIISELWLSHISRWSSLII